MRLVREQAGAGAAPRISVLVPAYRHERFIGECLASIAACTNPAALDVIVIDDGSPDRTLAIACAAEMPADMRLRVFAKANGGLVSSLRAGLELANSAHLCVMASDDRFAPGGLDAALRAIDACDPDRAIICDARYANGRMEGVSVYGPETDALFATNAAERYRALSIRYPEPLLLQSSILPTALLRAEQVWSDGLELDDWPTYLKIARAELEGRARLRFRRDVVLAQYRETAGAVHTDPVRMQRMCLEVVHKLVNKRYQREAKGFVLLRAAMAYKAQHDWAAFIRNGLQSFITDPRNLCLALSFVARRLSVRSSPAPIGR